MDLPINKREIVSPKLIVNLEIELTDSRLKADEATDKLNAIINSHSAQRKPFSEFIVFLLRETKSSLGKMKKLVIYLSPKEPSAPSEPEKES